MKRGRNQRRRQGVNINRALDSNGPDVRIRGTANQIYDKYLALARDATSSGDRVKAENYLQHAEHYFRLIRSIQPSMPMHNDQIDADGDQPSIGDGQGGNGGDHRSQQRRHEQSEDRFSGAGDDEDGESAENETRQPNGAEGDGQQQRRDPRPQNAQRGEGGDGDQRRRRRRPRRPTQGGDDAPEEREREEEPVADAAQ
ncbi:MAG: DUF4167 domain-containing protein [Pseudomonadota bacterium]|nr:DUF4167 domain-containing protein [Pseudomonadota bacterium]